MNNLFVTAFAFALVACGGRAPEPAIPSGTPREAPMPSANAAKPRMTVEYVVIHQKWVEKTMTPNGSDVSAWAETPDGKAATLPERREVVFKTKKEADAALARAKKGEALEPGDGPMNTAADAAYANLAPGDATIVTLSPSEHVVVAKMRPTEVATERAFKKAKAPELAQKLASALLSRLQKPEADARAIIAEVVGELLGDRAVADPDRPQPVVIDDDRLRHARLQPNAKEAVTTMLKTAKAGDTVSAPIVDGPTITVARAVPPIAEQ